MQTQKAYIGHLAMFGANLLWGVMTPLSKAVLQNGMVSPFSLTTLRMVGAAAAFWILSIFTRREHVPPHDLAMLFFAAMLGVTINQACFIAGVGLSSPIDASVITTTTPILTMILAALYLKEPITSKKVLGIFSSAIGALILIFSARTLSTSAGSKWHLRRSALSDCRNLFCLLLRLFQRSDQPLLGSHPDEMDVHLCINMLHTSVL